jgi:hypothetical protein
MNIVINILVLAISAIGSIGVSQMDCFLRDCTDGSGLKAIVKIGLPVLMLYTVVTLGVVYRVALVLLNKWGAFMAALLPSAIVATSISLCFFDSRSQNFRHIVTLTLDLGVPWFTACIVGVQLTQRPTVAS